MDRNGSAVDRDQYVCGLDHVEVLRGGCSRYVFYTEERTESGELLRKITLKVVMPAESLPDAIMKSCAAASFALMGAVLKPLH